jgi:uncharacterized membrane protein YkoI
VGLGLNETVASAEENNFIKSAMRAIVMKEIETVEKSSLFNQWKKQHPDSYLVHFFCMNEQIQIGYYEKKADTITTFILGKEITQTVDTEIFKQHKVIPALNLNDVQISLQKAKEIVKQLLKKYPDPVTKEIIVLQTLEKEPVYNITLITATFKMLNVKIHAKNGEILKEEMQSLMQWCNYESGNRQAG